MISRTNILSLLNDKNNNFHPLFSGLISVSEAGLESEGLRFHETHRGAASTYRVSGFELEN